ncbi:Endo-1,4-beta-glucanase [Metamycoplasma alkalescens 14918]|uniref:Endo-1,4-beta-glucanase n=1 Tax=Metamycoplasma alkalescens 14918 TaxID=1188234 RepID=N9SQJ2_9BACT|nr:M42 family metallopeptidase [Metamycoplasma alkalescens]ENY53639.1 Endo-1,4-beta-glucanase [Metamycoplasma alkalescens 14918]
MDKKEQFKNRLIKYMNIEAMSRYEEPVVNELKDALKSLDFEISRDNLGSVIFRKKSKNPNPIRIMIAAHMDEVGFIVRNIDKKGQLFLSPVGGIWPSSVIGTKAKLVTDEGKTFFGVFGHTSIHIMQESEISKAITNNELYADFGFKSDEDAISQGAGVGDLVYMSGETIFFNDPNLIGGKAMDNRAGVTVLEYVAKEIATKNLDVELYLVGTAQEEVGTRGARTSVSLIKPQIAIALDTCASHDTPNTIPGNTSLYKGAALRIKDRGTMMDPKLVKVFQNIAKKYQIPTYKFVAMGGGTDAHELQFAHGGAATLTISLPQRYLHSPIGVCAISDLIAAGDLLIHFLEDFNEATWKEIKYN